MKNHPPIKHIWFDFSDTIGRINRNISNKILYELYAGAVGKEVNDELKKECAAAFEKHKSNSAIFTSLGFPAGYLADAMNVVPPNELYSLTDPEIPEVIQKLQNVFPVSIFSNNRMDSILPALGVNLNWFTHILGPRDVKKPKPDLEGFRKMVEVSQVLPGEILYIGDDVHKDLMPAMEVGITTGLLWKESEHADYCFTSFRAILEHFA